LITIGAGLGLRLHARLSERPDRRSGWIETSPANDPYKIMFALVALLRSWLTSSSHIPCIRDLMPIVAALTEIGGINPPYGGRAA